MDKVSMLPDTPIERVEDDLLGRDQFAENLASLILNAPQGSTLRLGVYGGWGEGKTSVLRVMRSILKSKGIICVWIAPSLATSKTEVAAAITRELARELDIDLHNLESAQRLARFFGRARSAAEIDPKIRLVDALFAPGLEKLLGGRIARAEERFSREVEQRINGKKLVVFVDDLDRLSPELVPTILLTLREALDFPNCFYVLGLAPDIVETGLSSLNIAWGEPRQFLEKIVELPQYLPKVSHDTWLAYGAKLIENARAAINVAALADIASYLPTNPRRLKLFIRYLASLSGHVARFGPDGLDLRLLYLAQLLRTEFPREVQSLLDDEKTLNEMGYAGLSEIVQRKSRMSNEQVSERPEDKHVDSDHPDRNRFLSLCQGLRERGGLGVGSIGLRRVLEIPDALPLVTYYEAVVQANVWLEEPDQEKRSTKLRSVLSTLASHNLETLREAWSRLIEVREGHLAGVIEFDLESDMVSGLSEGFGLADMIEAFAQSEFGFTSGYLALEQWKQLRSHAQRWAHFTKHPEHERLRAREIRLVEKTFGLLSPNDRAELLPLLRPERMVDPSPGSAFVEMIDRLQTASREAAIDLAIGRFELPDGLEILWGGNRARLYEMLLVNPSSPVFTDPDSYSRLLAIAEEAPRSAAIQKNFLTFFRQLAYGATEGGSFSMDDCRRILSDEGLMRTIWNAAVARPLNPRVVGSLRKHRMRLAPTIVSIDTMQLPSWWLMFEAVGYWKDDSSESVLGDDGDV